MSGSFLLTPERAKTACEIAVFALEGLLAQQMIEHANVHIVVVDPTKTFASDQPFNQAILYEHEHGKPKAKYKSVAWSKARISWRTGLPSHLVQQAYPYLLETGDTKWGGSAAREGLVVACSGLSWQWDWAISNMIIDAIQALSLGIMRDIVLNNDITFLGNQ